MSKPYILPTIIAVIIGIAGVLLLLFAWHLTPFRSAEPTTENAYIRGKVTTVTPQLSGYISEVAVNDFQTVKKDDVIARTDDRIFRQKLAQAEAQLASAKGALKMAEQNVVTAKVTIVANKAALSASKSALETAEANWTRSNALTKRGVSSQSSADESELALQQARAAVTQAESQLQVQQEAITSAQVALSAKKADIANAEAAVELAKIDLDNTVIRAPADGRLGQVTARLGQYVTPGTALVSHVGKDIWIIANFKETELHGMRVGETVHFTVDALQSKAFTGKVASFSPATASEFSLMSGTNATGNFTKVAQRVPVRISVDPEQEMSEHLAPGLSVVVKVDTEGLAQQ